MEFNLLISNLLETHTSAVKESSLEKLDCIIKASISYACRLQGIENGKSCEIEKALNDFG